MGKQKRGLDKFMEKQQSFSRAGDVDILRSIGIILMIMGHVWFGYIFDKWIHGFHMPLWFIISGFFLNTKRNPRAYLKRKAKALLVPYFFFGICFELIWTIAGHNQWAGLIWPNSIEIPLNGALWFLPAMFFVDIIGMLLFKYFNAIVAEVILLLLAIFGSLHLISLPLSTDSALVGCGFFLIGKMIREYGKNLLNMKILLSVCLMLFASAFIIMNGYVNVRTNEYAIIPLFWLSAVLFTVALWSICRRIDEKIHHIKIPWLNKGLIILKEIGSDSLIYVCTNQFFLFFLKRLPIPGNNMVVMIIWHLTEVVIIVAVCFVTNRIIKKTPIKFILGK